MTEMIRNTEEGKTNEPKQSIADLVAQVLVFLLKEIRQNNPDSARECDHLKRLIVEEFGEVDGEIIPPTPAAAEPAAPVAPPISPKPSRRFRR